MPEKKNVVALNAMLYGYISSKKLNEAHQLFRSMPEKNLISFSAVTSGPSGVRKLAYARSPLDALPFPGCGNCSPLWLCSHHGHDQSPEAL